MKNTVMICVCVCVCVCSGGAVKNSVMMVMMFLKPN